jgi:hypothetical protein
MAEKTPLGDKSNLVFANMLDELKSQNQAAEAMKNSAEFSKNLQQTLNDKSNDLTLSQTDAINSLIESLQGNKFDDLESRKEANDTAKETLKLLGEIAENTEDLGTDTKLEGAGLKTAAALGGILVAMTGFVQGVILGIADSIRLLGKGLRIGIVKTLGISFKIIDKILFGRLTRLVDATTDFLKGIRGAFAFGNNGLKTYKAGLIKDIANLFERITRNIRLATDAIAKTGSSYLKIIKTNVLALFTKIASPFKAIGGLIGKSINYMTESLKGAKEAFRSIGKTLGLVADGGKEAGKFGKTIGATLKTLGGFFKSVFTVFQGIGKTLGKLFLPLTIILSAFDFVKGALDGFKSSEGGMLSKLSAAFSGGLEGLLTGLIGMPLDLLKSGVGWIAGKLGFENFQKVLAGFSFSKLIGGLFDKINSGVSLAFDFIGNLFTQIIPDLLTNIKNKLVNMARTMANFVKAMAAGTAAAVKALLPGGKKPGEEFSRAFKATLDSGKAQTTQTEIGENIEIPNVNTGGELESNSRALNESTRQSGINVAGIVTAVTSSQTSNRGGDTIIVNSESSYDPVAIAGTNR